MVLSKVFVTICALAFTLRTIFRIFGAKNSDSAVAFHVFCALTLDVCGILATRAVVFWCFSLLIACGSAILLLKKHTSPAVDGIIYEFLDDFIAQMRAGNSFESVSRELSAKKPQWKSWIECSKKKNLPSSALTYGQSPEEQEIVSVLRFCAENPSRSFKILNSMRETHVLKSRLERKRRALSLQARAQAALSAAIYFCIAGFEWVTLPPFQSFLRAPAGKIAALLSMTLLGSGIWVIFSWSKAKGIAL